MKTHQYLNAWKTEWHRWEDPFLVDRNLKVKGSLTDGDIRRALIKGLTVNYSAKNIAKKDFIFLRKDSEHEAKKSWRDINQI